MFLPAGQRWVSVTAPPAAVGKWVFLNVAPLFGTICSDTERESRPCWQEQLAGCACVGLPSCLYTPGRSLITSAYMIAIK